MGTSEIDILISILEALLTLASLILAIVALRFSIQARSELSSSEQIGNLKTLFIDVYQHRKFNEPINIENEKITKLKDARLHARTTIVDQNKQIFNRAKLETFWKKSLKVNQTWQNRFAYELSISLESVGAAVLAGAIPLSYVLASNAEQILQDWIYCHKLIEERIRTQTEVPLPKENGTGNYISRRRMHGEWIAYTSAIWLSKNWRGGIIEQFETIIGSVDFLRSNEKKLRDQSENIISNQTTREIKKLLES